MTTTAVHLTDTELTLLDGRCSDDVQKKVEQAKDRLQMGARLTDVPPAIAGFVADAIAEAKARGLLICQDTALRFCKLCGQSGGFHTYPRNGRHHRKGEIDLDRPKMLHGVELADRVVTMKGYPTLGCCSTCWNVARPLLAAELQTVRAQVSSAITGHPPAWRLFSNRTCACGWVGHEGLMLPVIGLFSGREVPGKCPACKREDNQFGLRVVMVADGFTLVPVPVVTTAPEVSR